VLLVVILLAPAVGRAAHPLGVEDTGTEGKGNYLLEFTGDSAKKDAFKSTRLTTIMTAGTGKHTDLSVEIPYLMLDPGPVPNRNESGVGDVRLKLKHRLFENEVHQSMGYLLYVDLPSGDGANGLGKDNVVWGVRLIDSQKCCDWTLHLNAGYEVFGSDLKTEHFMSNYAINFGFAVEHPLSESFRFLAEFSGERRKEAGTFSRPLDLLGGVIYDISRSWYIDLGVRAGLNKYADDYVVQGGAAWRF
jgi:hypothetical protein